MVLGPTFFIIYVNDVFNLKINSELISYADDTFVLIEGNNFTEIISNYVHFRISNALSSLHSLLRIHNFNCLLKDNCCCSGIKCIPVIKYLGP